MGKSMDGWMGGWIHGLCMGEIIGIAENMNG